jgi:hypothetical protein
VRTRRPAKLNSDERTPSLGSRIWALARQRHRRAHHRHMHRWTDAIQSTRVQLVVSPLGGGWGSRAAFAGAQGR